MAIQGRVGPPWMLFLMCAWKSMSGPARETPLGEGSSDWNSTAERASFLGGGGRPTARLTFYTLLCKLGFAHTFCLANQQLQGPFRAVSTQEPPCHHMVSPAVLRSKQRRGYSYVNMSGHAV
eukprot:CAMPEP_0206517214 /NCGR_PEP_ID=MMETSP0324_2-20121206/63838_1 /ASSEMBLY_ACC=CAM_ASM_000836 /TAXON_ID=2866 /ORGANISM="Crypthecodinium cohnii, Strain Seligo" /LENGTH=121 /DNA_ID=CAMNT_0054010313 /DNA_START=94 /DNA_END=459 /DNA_ORIENTATION=+